MAAPWPLNCKSSLALYDLWTSRLGLGHNAVLRLQLTPFDEVATLITQGHGGGRIGGVCGQGGGTGGGTGGTEGGGGTAGGSTEGEGDRWCQVRCVAEHPREARFATAGDDGVLKVWSLASADEESRSGGCVSTLTHGQTIS